MSDSETTKAAEALKTFPLPSQGATMTENYRRILEWLYRDNPSVASLIIELGRSANDD